MDCLSSLHKPKNCQPDRPIVQKQPRVSNSKGKKGKQMRREVMWAVVITTTEACVIFSFFKKKETATVLPVFSQPSSSLWSEQSSSPSHLHDRRMQRPFPQRNWSAVHMDVAAGRANTHHLFSYLLTNPLLLISFWFCQVNITDEDSKQTLRDATQLFSEVSSYSLQFFSSDWSSQSNSPSHLQPALMHIPLLHMNSTDLQGWWEAAHTK